jgi:hypothetical protein
MVDDVPEEFVVEHQGVRCMDQQGDGACVALDPVTRLCTIYERRPQVCRDFKRAESLCRRAVFGRRGSLAGEAGPSDQRVAASRTSSLAVQASGLGSSRSSLET